METAPRPVQLTAPERTRRKLRKAGGSKAVVLPKSWLQRLGVEDEVELVESGDGILVLPVKGEHCIEDEPEFARFLSFLVEKARNDPEGLVNVAELIKDDDELFRDVPAE